MRQYSIVVRIIHLTTQPTVPSCDDYTMCAIRTVVDRLSRNGKFATAARAGDD